MRIVVRWSQVCLISILVLGSSARAHAQTDATSQAMPGIGAEAMQAAMTHYFRGERLGGVGFAAVGTGSLVAGGILLAGDSEMGQGMSYPLLGFGAVQAIVGTVVIFQSGPRIRRFTDQIRDDPSTYRDKEGARIDRTLVSVRWLLYTEIAVAIGGAGLAVYGARTDRDRLTGIGLGLSIEAVTLLVQDSLVSRRARRYREALRDFHVAISPASHDYLLMYSATF